MPDRARARDRHAALWPRRPDAAHPARDRKKLGISRSYVSRIEKRALEKLEEAIGERG
ncbi:MAG: sigma factor-like helix-turn-helix DNA-binding protein [Oscillospiraceae bacterium]